MYSRDAPRSPAPHRSLDPGLFLGLIITLAAVVAYSGYITRQISGLRELQNNLVDRNRKDSLQPRRNEVQSRCHWGGGENLLRIVEWNVEWIVECGIDPIAPRQGRVQLSVAIGTARNLRAGKAGQDRSSGDRMAQRQDRRIQEPRRRPGLRVRGSKRNHRSAGLLAVQA